LFRFYSHITIKYLFVTIYMLRAPAFLVPLNRRAMLSYQWIKRVTPPSFAVGCAYDSCPITIYSIIDLHAVGAAYLEL